MQVGEGARHGEQHDLLAAEDLVGGLRLRAFRPSSTRNVELGSLSPTLMVMGAVLSICPDQRRPRSGRTGGCRKIGGAGALVETDRGLDRIRPATAVSVIAAPRHVLPGGMPSSARRKALRAGRRARRFCPVTGNAQSRSGPSANSVDRRVPRARRHRPGCARLHAVVAAEGFDRQAVCRHPAGSPCGTFLSEAAITHRCRPCRPDRELGLPCAGMHNFSQIA